MTEPILFELWGGGIDFSLEHIYAADEVEAIVRYMSRMDKSCQFNHVSIIHVDRHGCPRKHYRVVHKIMLTYEVQEIPDWSNTWKS